MAEALTAIPERRRLWVEFLAFFVTAPVLIAVLLPASAMFPALFAFTALGLLLLHITPGFSWAELRWNWRGWDWRELLAFAVFMTLLSVTLIYAMRPSSAFQLVREQPQLLAFIWIGYPLVSALPQELLFRPLFFRRYRPILPPGLAGRGLNAAVFSLAHLMYWSWVVALLTFGGGLIFAWAYRRRGSFFYAVALHAIAGNILFAAGMGAYFYSGNVERPF